MIPNNSAREDRNDHNTSHNRNYSFKTNLFGQNLRDENFSSSSYISPRLQVYDVDMVNRDIEDSRYDTDL